MVLTKDGISYVLMVSQHGNGNRLHIATVDEQSWRKYNAYITRITLHPNWTDAEEWFQVIGNQYDFCQSPCGKVRLLRTTSEQRATLQVCKVCSKYFTPEEIKEMFDA